MISTLDHTTVENLVDILMDMPDFGYSFQDGRETGGVLFDMYKRQRDMVVWPMILAGSLAWLVTGRFDHRVRAAVSSERVKPVTEGVHPLMRTPAKPLERDDSAPHAAVSFGRDHDPGAGWFGRWLASLPSRSLLFLMLVFALPPLWDAAVDGSGWAAGAILNPVYSGDPAYPCPRGWYVDGALDVSNPELLAHHKSVQWLMMQDKTGGLEAMCRPELRVRYMLEQWAGQTKAIPPPLDASGSLWETMASMGGNA